MTSRVATTAVLAALFLSTGVHATPRWNEGPRPGQGFGPPPREDGEHGPGHRRPQLFISPAGEPFRAPAEAPYPVAAWFSAGDANHDGALSRDEFVADAGRFFTVLDTDKDGVIDGFEVSAYERNIAPEILQGVNIPPGGGRGGRGGPPGGGDGPPRKRGGLVGGALQGAAPYALLAEPQPVMGADADFNRRISRDEAVKAAKSRFALLDADKDALLRVEELPATPVQARRR
ncbi:hypothetical protein ACN2C6_09960 [Caulobacter sp. ErkDOM-YI]|uniref:hypothetical protein n=1 Tax=unclassified Caulobacter TaxID=2648921 RepID=UPI003AF5DFC2